MGEQVLRVKDQSGNVHDLATQNQSLEYAVRVVDEDVYSRLNELAKEATLGAIQTLLSNEDFAQNSTLDALRVAFNAEDFASEATLSALNTAFGAEDFASETTLSSINSKVATNAQLTTLTNELSALHADLGDVSDLDTANTVIGRLKRILAVLVSLDSKDFSTETTLAALNTNFVGEDFAQEATLSAFKNAFDARDLASGADITNLQNALGQTTDLDTANTVIGRLKQLISLFDAEDFASETTLAALHTTIQNEDFATETTLAAVRSAVDAINANTDTLETLLTTIRDEEFRRTDPLAAGTNLIGQVGLNANQTNFVTPSMMAKISDSKFFTISIRQDVASGTEASWSIENPSGSTKVVYIVHVSAQNDNTSQIWFDVYKNSTMTGATAYTPWNPNFANPVASVANVSAGEGVRSGGTALQASLGVVREAPFRWDGLIILPPGQSLQLTGVVPGTLSAQNIAVGARWYEE